jgi:hypothetical protein
MGCLILAIIGIVIAFKIHWILGVIALVVILGLFNGDFKD